MRIRKALVIKTEQEENGCVQIRHTYTIDDRLVTELVSLAISEGAKPHLLSSCGETDRACSPANHYQTSRDRSQIDL